MNSKGKSKELNPEEQAAFMSEFSSESAFFQPTSTQVGKTTSGQVDKPTKLPKYTTHLLPETIQAIKLYAVQHKMKDYEVVQQALDQFFAPEEQEPA